ncbi:hypothetical protein [Lentibacillus salicampi]|uniref:Uncharacterized protein n=1 Tax=Lentibacillus salicampi TaxID=175306 RepID=A0A4Y9ACG4_9BACI|nr:hypothetical protein [Lentibacillus salicampi]TFJ93125.1 hypothetical protein E4U82_08630 [Lentibacillus salicampi]
MRIKDVTANCQNEVKMVKIFSPDESPKIKVYDSESTHFLHEVGNNRQVLSISCKRGRVTEKEWLFGIREIMELELEGVEIETKPSGVVFIREKDESMPRTADCYH